MNAEAQKIVLTGGAGFIGSELSRQLANTGADVTIVDNLANGKLANIEEILSDRVRFVKADIRDKGAMSSILKGKDRVFHLACLGVRHSIHSPFENHEVNATATLNLLGLAKEHGIQRFVYVSSSEVYGTAKWVPMTEDYPPSPMTVYGGGKLAGENYSRAYFETYGFPTVMVRPFNAYGPRSHHEGDSGEVIPKFMLRAMVNKPLLIFGDGKQTRDFSFVSDTASGILKAGFSDRAIGQTINIGAGSEITVNDLAKTVLNVISQSTSDVKYEEARPADVLRLYSDSSKAKDLLGYTAQTSLEEGLRKLYEWYKQQPKGAAELLEDEKPFNWLAAKGK